MATTRRRPPTPLDPDTDDGGVKDGLEDFDGDGVVDPGEMDPNNAPDDDNLVDTDGDGIDDAQEPLLGSDPTDADSDDDGIADGDEPNGANDTDGDGNRNLVDPDSDDDGLQDGTEIGLTEGTVDTDPDVFIPDADPDTTTSPLDPDTDDGGVSDGDEDADKNGRVDDGERDPNDPADDDDAATTKTATSSSTRSTTVASDANPDQADLDGDDIGDVCDPTIDLGAFGGGALTGCSSTDVTTDLPLASLALLLLGGALFGRRKKHALVVVLAALALAAVPAAAQEELTNFPAERFRAAMDKEGIVDVEWGRVTPHLSYDLGVIGWYAHNPMLLYRKEGNQAVERVQTLVGSRVGLSLVGQVGLFDVVELGPRAARGRLSRPPRRRPFKAGCGPHPRRPPARRHR